MIFPRAHGRLDLARLTRLRRLLADEGIVWGKLLSSG